MAREQRRYPRVSCDVPAELWIAGDRSIPVLIRSLTCEGMGLLLPEPPGRPPERDTKVTVRLDASGRAITLHGRVAWYRPPADDQVMNLGIHIEVEPIDDDTAEAWAQWVVSRIRESHGVPPKVGAWLHWMTSGASK